MSLFSKDYQWFSVVIHRGVLVIKSLITDVLLYYLKIGVWLVPSFPLLRIAGVFFCKILDFFWIFLPKKGDFIEREEGAIIFSKEPLS